jgi:hypothetical protein
MPEPTPASDSLADFRRLLDSMKQSGASTSEREERLMRENFKLRDKLRTERTDHEATKGKLPKDGTVGLTADEGKEWVAFKALGIPAADVKTKLAERDTLALKVDASAQEQVYADAAKALDLPNVRALQKLLAREGLVVETKTVKVRGADGTTTDQQVPYVRKRADAADKLEPLADYLEREQAEFIPALTAEPENEGDSPEDREPSSTQTPARRLGASSTGTSTSTAAAPGVRFPRVGVRPAPTAGQRSAKEQEDAVAKKRSTGHYHL